MSSMESSEARNELFKLLYNTRAFITALPISKYMATPNGIEFPSHTKGESYCFLFFSDAVIADFNTLKNKFPINFEPRSCRITVYANDDFAAPKTNDATLCHYTLMYTIDNQKQELRIYYNNAGEIIMHNGKDENKARTEEIYNALIEVPMFKSIHREFSTLLKSVYKKS